MLFHPWRNATVDLLNTHDTYEDHYFSIVSIVKNKCGNLSDSNNYRLVAISNVCSKIFEHVILYLCEDYLWTADNQFGFKAGLGSDMCIYALREFVEHYKARSTTVFVSGFRKMAECNC